MALFRGIIEKRLGAEYWTNTYTLKADTLTDANTALSTVLDFELAIHSSRVEFVKRRVSTLAALDYVYITTPIVANGDVGVTGYTLPLWNCFMLFMSDNVKRPDRKYYRPGLTNNNMDLDFSWSTDYLAVVSTAIENYLVDLIASDGIVSSSGASFAEVTRQRLIAMRQLKRGSKRTTPVIP